MKIFASIIFAVFCSSIAIAQTPRINFEAPYQYPEGVAYHPQKDLFYVSSVKTGTIGSVDKTGVYKVVLQDKDLKSTFGMKVDATGNYLWVCASDPHHSKYSTPETFKKMARLVSIDLKTGKKVADINLAALYPGKHFANDLAFDDSGNLYITDSFSPLIYKVDAKGKSSIFAQSDLFIGKDIGLNGIVYHPKGFLLVANMGKGEIIKVDVKNPLKISKVKMNILLPGVDGLLLDEQNNLVLIQNKGINNASLITSADNWITAKVTASTSITDRFQHPTTGTIKNGKVYLLNSKINELSDSSITPSKEYSLQLVDFKRR